MFMSIMLMTKITLDNAKCGVLSTKDMVSLEVEKICGRIAMCKCTKSCNKTTYFCVSKQTQSKMKRPKLLIALGDFQYKV